LKRERGYADAHFNLARFYERSGRKIASLRHLREYKKLTIEHYGFVGHPPVCPWLQPRIDV
jgi:hypothetical protein